MLSSPQQRNKVLFPISMLLNINWKFLQFNKKTWITYWMLYRIFQHKSTHVYVNIWWKIYHAGDCALNPIHTHIIFNPWSHWHIVSMLNTFFFKFLTTIKRMWIEGFFISKINLFSKICIKSLHFRLDFSWKCNNCKNIFHLHHEYFRRISLLYRSELCFLECKYSTSRVGSFISNLIILKKLKDALGYTLFKMSISLFIILNFPHKYILLLLLSVSECYLRIPSGMNECN